METEPRASTGQSPLAERHRCGEWARMSRVGLGSELRFCHGTALGASASLVTPPAVFRSPVLPSCWPFANIWRGASASCKGVCVGAGRQQKPQSTVTMAGTTGFRSCGCRVDGSEGRATEPVVPDSVALSILCPTCTSAHALPVVTLSSEHLHRTQPRLRAISPPRRGYWCISKHLSLLA